MFFIQQLIITTVDECEKCDDCKGDIQREVHEQWIAEKEASFGAVDFLSSPILAPPTVWPLPLCLRLLGPFSLYTSFKSKSCQDRKTGRKTVLLISVSVTG